MDLQTFAVTGGTLITIDAILKEMYGPKIVDQFQSDIPLLKFAQSTDKIPYVGKKFVLPIRVGRNRSPGFRAEGAVMPAAGKQGYTSVIVTPSYFYGRYSVTGQAIEASRNDEGAFAHAMAKEASGLADDITKQVNQCMYLGATGVRGTVSSVSGTGPWTITLTGPSKGLEVGMYVDVLSSDVATQRNTGVLTITAVVDAGLSDLAVTGITVSGTASGITGTDVVVLSYTVNSGSGIGFIGLADAIGTGNYLTVNSATYPVWKANLLTNGGTKRSISEDLIQQARDVTRQKSGKTPNFFLTTFNLRRRFYNGLAPNRRYVNTKKMVAGGVELVDYDGTDLVADPDCPNYGFYGLTKDVWATAQTRDGHWIDDDGRILVRALDDTDNFWGTWRWAAQMFCEQRNANFLLGDLTE